MLTVLSPAKKLKVTPDLPHPQSTQVLFANKTMALIERLRPLTVAEIASLMKLSETLARLNFERYQDFDLAGSADQPSANALFLFQGDVYQSLAADSLNETAIAFAQQHLAILSGLYGLLRPLDLIQPYRLEMGTKLANPAGKDLYVFWQKTITGYLNQQLAEQQNRVLINLASNEYASAIDVATLNYPMVTINFKEKKNGQLKTIGIHAKKARGAMARYLLSNHLDTLEELKQFDGLEYQFAPELSTHKQLTFVR